MNKPRQILYCDDDCDDVEIMKGIFEGIQGAPELITASNGAVALDYLKEKLEIGRLPLFLLIDINMPVIDGKTLALRIKADHNLKHLPMAFITTSINQMDKDFALNLGMHFFSKPSSIDKLVKLAEEIVHYAATISIS